MRLFLFSFFLLLNYSSFSQLSLRTLPVNPTYLWAVDDYVLSQKKGQFPQPDVKPEYELGKSELLAFFREEIFDTDKSFTVSIGFLVNKKGEIGNFEILSKHNTDTQAITEDIVSLLHHLPATWLPAKFKGNYVDCYEVMNLLINNGEILRIDLK